MTTTTTMTCLSDALADMRTRDDVIHVMTLEGDPMILSHIEVWMTCDGLVGVYFQGHLVFDVDTAAPNTEYTGQELYAHAIRFAVNLHLDEINNL